GSLTNLSAISQMPASPPPAVARATSLTSSASRMTLSPRGQFQGKLEALLQTNPAAARQLVVDLTAKMRARASQHGDAHAGALADRLQSAADSGDLASLLDMMPSPGAARAGSTGAYAATASTRSS
ncbi:MAG: hypothetical protein WCJ30_23035, partial [Deltaproteobacteria bacterium]